MYVHIDKKGGREEAILRGTDGLSLFTDAGYAAEVRGMKIMDGVLHAVVGNSVYKILENGTVTNITPTAGGLISSFATSVFDAAAISPTDIEVAADGDLYVTDSGTSKVYDIQTDGTLNASFLVTDIDASATTPTGVAEDSNGDLLITESNTNKIFKTTSAGAIISFIGQEIDTLVYDSKYADVTTEVTTSKSIAFSADGTKLYASDDNTDAVYQYTLSVAWDASTATYASKSCDVSGQTTILNGIFFSSDGTKMYVSNLTNIYQYTLSVAWDVSTGTYATKTLDITGGTSNGEDIFLDSSGAKVFVVGNLSDPSVYQYTLSTPWDISTGTYDTKSKYVGDEAADGTGVFFSNEGTKMYVTSQVGVYQYELSTAFDVSTGVYDSKTFDLTNEGSSITDLFFNPEGTKFYAFNSSSGTEHRIYQYSVKSMFDSNSAAMTSVSVDTADGSYWIADSGTNTIYNIDTDGVLVSSFLTTSFDAAATNPTGVNSYQEVLWISDSAADKVYNTTRIGTVIKSFASSEFDALAIELQGCSQAPDTVLYCIDSSTDKIYKVQSSSLASSSGPVYMETDGTYIVVVDPSDGSGWYINDSTFSQINDADFPLASTLTYQDSFFLVTKAGTDQIYKSASGDPTAWNALDYISAEGSPDDLVRIKSFNREIWAFGSDSLEILQNTGNPNFPFERIPGSYRKTGCIAPDSVAEDSNFLFWLGDDRYVYRSEQMQEVVISTSHISSQINSYTTVTDAKGFAYSKDGHVFYVLTFPTEGKTWCYDLTTNEWHTRASGYLLDRHPANCHAYYAGKHLVGHKSNGKILYYDEDAYDDNGEELAAERVVPYVNKYPNREAHSKIELLCEAGVGTTSYDPKVALDYSDDNGATWVRGSELFTEEGFDESQFDLGDGELVGLGLEGETSKRQIWRRLGITRNRLYRFKMKHPYRKVWFGLYLNEQE